MFCPDCGKENVNDAVFCENCGRQLPNFQDEANSNQEEPSSGNSSKKKRIFLIVCAAAAVIAAIVLFVILTGKADSDEEYTEDTELEYTGGYAESYSNGDTVYIPSTKNLAYDEASYTIYYDDLLIVYLNSDISEDAADDLADKIGGNVVGDISGAVNVIQIQVESTDLDGINEYAQTLMELEDVIYAGYEYPIFSYDTYTDSNPWSDSGTESDLGNEDTPDGNDWWAEAIGAYTAWEIADSCDLVSVSVGIIDSGFDTDHEDLSDSISMLSDYSANSAKDHGVHVSGIIGADNNDIGIRGIADSADLICVDRTPNTNDGDASDYIDLLSTGEYIEILKQMIENGVKVINNSWCITCLISEEEFLKEADEDEEIFTTGQRLRLMFGDDSPLVEEYSARVSEIETEARQSAWDAMILIYELLLNGYDDFLVVQGSGNGIDNSGDGLDSYWVGSFAAVDEELFDEMFDSLFSDYGVSLDYTYEEFKEHVIIVGAAENETDTDGNYLVTFYSNWGDAVDIIAPGEYIYSTLTTADDAGDSENDGLIYGCLRGTSMAAPMVSGSAALLWQINPDLTAAEIKTLLIENSNTATGVTGDDAGTIYPMLNIGKAAQAALNRIVLDTFIDDFDAFFEAVGGSESSETGDHEKWIIADGIQYGNYQNSTFVDEITISSTAYELFGVYVGMDSDAAADLFSDWEAESDSDGCFEYVRDDMNLLVYSSDGLVTRLVFWREPEESTDASETDETKEDADMADKTGEDTDAADEGSTEMNIPSNAVSYNGHHYYIYDVGEDPEAAIAYCKSLGGYMAVITSKEEDEFLYEYILSEGLESAYFGLSDAAKEGTWVWLNGEDVSYTNWHSGEPNSENSSEDYAMFYWKFPDGTWNDGDFKGDTAFICEWDG